MPQLMWSKSAEIAAALLCAYPDVSRLALTREQLLEMVVSLPDFADAPQAPSTRYLDHILWTWMRLADEDHEGEAA